MNESEDTGKLEAIAKSEGTKSNAAKLYEARERGTLFVQQIAIRSYGLSM